jgi:hypothetical protein
VIAFFILAPLVAYYATGYRVGKKFEVAKTGGIYIVVEGKGFTILLNDQPQDISSLFRRNVFIQDLHPGRYTLRVDKEGYHSWGKIIDVQSEKVADVYPFNVPIAVDLVEIPKMIKEDTDQGASTTPVKEIENEEYITVKALFATSSERLFTQKLVASSTDVLPKQYILYKKIALWFTDDEIFVKWNGDEDNAPLYFCEQGSCLNKMSIFKGLKVNNVDLLSDKQEFVIFSTDSGLYITEIDGRGGRNIESFLVGSGYDFRIDNDQTLYIKKGKLYYRAKLSL